MKPPILISIPNSGSSWLGDVIGRHLLRGKYYREYFNPALCPRRHEDVLGAHFGTELVGYYRNIARGPQPGFDEAVRGTWFEQEQFTFTKHVFDPFKLEGFARHFAPFVLLRREEDSLPPKRGRVFGFYEHCWHSLRDAGFPVTAVGLVQRAHEAHRVMLTRLRSDAEALHIPILEYRDIFVGDEREQTEIFEPLIRGIANPVEVAKDIVATRRWSERPVWQEGAS